MSQFTPRLVKEKEQSGKISRKEFLTYSVLSVAAISLFPKETVHRMLSQPPKEVRVFSSDSGVQYGVNFYGA